MSDTDQYKQFAARMRAQGLPRKAIDSFCLNLEKLIRGGSGMLPEDQIDPISSLRDADEFNDYEDAGRGLLGKTVVIKLNGGLGTGMGLVKPKSLIAVRGGLTFLDLISRQMLCLREEVGEPVPLVMMNSHSTRLETLDFLANYPDLALEGLPLDFLQHRVPKVTAEGHRPARHPQSPDLEWCPPGHGDLYSALATSGMLLQLINRGIEYAFISNADNLGAVVDPRLLGFMAENGIDFMMEAADRTDSDRKGGHLCLVKEAGLALREVAQCPPEDLPGFQDINRFRYFNTNNLWLHLPSLAALLDHHQGVLPLAPIFNSKTVDPRDPSSTPVIHIETAMGAAISLFPNATAIRVPRHRFSPVKSTADLLATRSDAYDLTADYRVVQAANRQTPPVISLDDRYYQMLDAFDSRFPNGPPSLIDCTELEVQGDITFGRNIRIEGTATLHAEDEAKAISDGAVLSGQIRL